MSMLPRTITEPSAKTATRWNRMPRGLWLLIAIDFWERFSYYGMLAILVLFLKAAPATGGLGWAEGNALFFFGLYGASGFALPLVGGLIADRWIGVRRAVGWGASIMAAGHLLLAAAAFNGSYLVIFGALALIMAGNGLFKTPLITLIGDLFPATGGGRQVGYSLYYGAINAGAFCSSLIVGWLAEAHGWHAGFGAAGAGMVIAWLLFLLLGTRSLPASVGAAVVNRASPKKRLLPDERRGLRKLFVAAGLATLFAAGWFQFEGFWYVAFDTRVDRTIGEFTVPTAWALAFQTLLIVVGAPLIGELTSRLSLAPAYIFAAGFLLCAMAQLAGMTGLYIAGDAEQASMGWWVAVYALTALSELVLWQNTYAIVYQYAPQRFRSTILGFWLLTLAAGKFFAGTIGAAASGFGPLVVLPWLVVMLLACAVASLLFLPKRLGENETPAAVQSTAL